MRALPQGLTSAQSRRCRRWLHNPVLRQHIAADSNSFTVQVPASRCPQPQPRVCALQVVAALAQEQLLPAIVFLFSRRGCEQAVFTLHAAGVDLTSYVSLHTPAGHFKWSLQAHRPSTVVGVLAPSL